MMWRNDKQCAVLLTFDFDAESLWESSLGLSSPQMKSKGQYGARVGVPRILKLLEKHGISGTFFVPGEVIARYPELVREISDRGHEIGHHGYVHKNPIDFDLERETEEIVKGIEIIEKTIGKRPTGYRSPSWDHGPNTVELLLEHGFLYDSSMMGDDFSPYPLVQDGGRTRILELPVSWELDDIPHFLTNSFPYIVGLSAPSKVYEIWSSEFRGAYATENGVFNLTMHPQVMGRWHRLEMLEQLINYIKGFPGVWFTTATELTRAWLAANSQE